MKIHELDVKATKKIKRVGRGISAGQGKTAGRGTKGQKARTGAKHRAGFAGGQNPLMQQLPKLPGFRSLHTSAEEVYTGQLDALKAKTVTAETLAEAGLISSAYVSVKLLNKGELKAAVAVKLPAASASAIEAVEKAGGSFEKTARLQRPKTSTKKND
jgi:large subunit ribosomal protein L15